jgi:hypothetical protein
MKNATRLESYCFKDSSSRCLSSVVSQNSSTKYIYCRRGETVCIFKLEFDKASEEAIFEKKKKKVTVEKKKKNSKIKYFS